MVSIPPTTAATAIVTDAQKTALLADAVFDFLNTASHTTEQYMQFVDRCVAIHTAVETDTARVFLERTRNAPLQQCYGAFKLGVENLYAAHEVYVEIVPHWEQYAASTRWVFGVVIPFESNASRPITVHTSPHRPITRAMFDAITNKDAVIDFVDAAAANPSIDSFDDLTLRYNRDRAIFEIGVPFRKARVEYKARGAPMRDVLYAFIHKEKIDAADIVDLMERSSVGFEKESVFSANCAQAVEDDDSVTFKFNLYMTLKREKQCIFAATLSADRTRLIGTPAIDDLDIYRAIPRNAYDDFYACKPQADWLQSSTLLFTRASERGLVPPVHAVVPDVAATSDDRSPAKRLADALFAFINIAEPTHEDYAVFAKQCVCIHFDHNHDGDACSCSDASCFEATLKPHLSTEKQVPYENVRLEVLERTCVSNDNVLIVEMKKRVDDAEAFVWVEMVNVVIDRHTWCVEKTWRRTELDGCTISPRPISRTLFDLVTCSDAPVVYGNRVHEEWGPMSIRYCPDEARFQFHANRHTCYVKTRGAPVDDVLFALFNQKTPTIERVLDVIERWVYPELPDFSTPESLRALLDAVATRSVSTKHGSPIVMRFYKHKPANSFMDTVYVFKLFVLAPGDDSLLYHAEISTDLTKAMWFTKTKRFTTRAAYTAFIADCVRQSIKRERPADTPLQTAPIPRDESAVPDPAPPLAKKQATATSMVLVNSDSELAVAYPLDQVGKPLDVELCTPATAANPTPLFGADARFNPFAVDSSAYATLCDSELFHKAGPCSGRRAMQIVSFKDVCVALLARKDEPCGAHTIWYYHYAPHTIQDFTTYGDIHAFLVRCATVDKHWGGEPTAVWVVENI